MALLAQRPASRCGTAACYSGGGGEVWENGDWRPISKEDLQRRFMETDEFEILLCTDSASEGLSLQAASKDTIEDPG